MTAGTIAPRLAVILLLAIATTFASNHIAARIAFEHGTSVTTAVVVRSCCTTLFVYALLRAQGVVIALKRPQLLRVLGVGVLIATGLWTRLTTALSGTIAGFEVAI